MLDAKKILFENYNEFAQAIGVYNIPAVQGFENQFITPSAAADEMSDSFNNAVSEVADSAFVVGFNAAIQLVSGDPKRIRENVAGTLDADLLALFCGLDWGHRYELVTIARSMEAENARGGDE
jgi:hypothetical protein